MQENHKKITRKSIGQSFCDNCADAAFIKNTASLLLIKKWSVSK
ncbi:MAG: hypothetical protein PVJ67_03985 [Candidatus Pacearchaeota archaeon]